LTARASISSRHITSEAIAEPPGLSMRTTMARIDESSRTFFTHCLKVSEPMTLPPMPSNELLPLAIVPTA